jgi:hypothetical protein
MRLAGLFKRLLRLERVRVVGLEIVEEAVGEAVVVELARRERRRARCARCGRAVRAIYDRSVRSWRHLDLLRVRCVLRCEVRRVSCPACGVVAEQVPWARPGARFTRALPGHLRLLGPPRPPAGGGGAHALRLGDGGPDRRAGCQRAAPGRRRPGWPSPHRGG